MKQANSRIFDRVKRIGRTLPHVAAGARYDGTPVLKVAGVFMAGIATHRSAERNTLVIRADVDKREAFIDDAPESYYLTEYYRQYPLILVRLERVTPEVLRELLIASYRLTLPKTRLTRGATRPLDRRAMHASRAHKPRAAPPPSGSLSRPRAYADRSASSRRGTTR